MEFYFHTFLILTLNDVSCQIHSPAALPPPEETVLLTHSIRFQMRLEFGEKEALALSGRGTAISRTSIPLAWSTTPSRHQQPECRPLKFVSMHVWFEGKGKGKVHPTTGHETQKGSTDIALLFL